MNAYIQECAQFETFENSEELRQFADNFKDSENRLNDIYPKYIQRLFQDTRYAESGQANAAWDAKKDSIAGAKMNLNAMLLSYDMFSLHLILKRSVLLQAECTISPLCWTQLKIEKSLLLTLKKIYLT